MLRLVARPTPSRALTLAAPLFALALTVGLGAVLFVALGQPPGRALALFFIEPLRGADAWSELAVKATPLALVALGLAVCFRANVWNIGAEGQFIMGAIAATWVAMRAHAGQPRRADRCRRSRWPAWRAARPGRASSPCCAIAGTPARSWSA